LNFKTGLSDITPRNKVVNYDDNENQLVFIEIDDTCINKSIDASFYDVNGDNENNLDKEIITDIADTKKDEFTNELSVVEIKDAEGAL
jgi:hypothetical protein